MPVSPGTTQPAGRTLGKYTLLGRLAQGGMGEILLARLSGAAGFEKYVVIKRLRRHLDGDEGSVQAFLDEARIVARISHPNVCQVHELGVEDGRYFLAMEYLEGLPLSGLIRRANRDRTPLDLRAVAGLVEQACEGLQHVHNLRHLDGRPAAVLHRDVSPQNLFVTVDGAVKILDFGIAKSGDSSVKTPTGRIKGKSAYMSPEQIRGAELDGRSDIYSLGVVLYEAVTGKPLFQRGDVAETFRAIREDTLPFLRDVPSELNGVVQRAVARERDERFDSARALGRAVGEAVAGLGGSMSPPQLAEWLTQRFADDLREQRERIGQAIAARPGSDDGEDRLRPGTVVAARSLATESGELSTGGTLPLVAPSAELWSHGALAAERAPPEPAPPRRRRLAVAALALAGLIAAIIWIAGRGEPSGGGDAMSAGGAMSAAARGEDPNSAGALGQEPMSAEARGEEPMSAARGEEPMSAARGEEPMSAAARGQAPMSAGPDPAPAAPPRASRPRRARARPADPGYFTIDSMPYATIYIDGAKRGVTPILRLPLAAGTHTVAAVTADGRRKSFRVTIQSGREARRRRLDW